MGDLDLRAVIEVLNKYAAGGCEDFLPKLVRLIVVAYVTKAETNCGGAQICGIFVVRCPRVWAEL